MNHRAARLGGSKQHGMYLDMSHARDWIVELPPAAADLTRLTNACDFMAQLLPHAVTF